MIGVHWRGQFIEMVPWNGEVQASTLSKQPPRHHKISLAALSCAQGLSLYGMSLAIPDHLRIKWLIQQQGHTGGR